MDLRRGHFSVKMYAKMKELGSIGGVRRARPPRSADGLLYYTILKIHYFLAGCGATSNLPCQRPEYNTLILAFTTSGYIQCCTLMHKRTIMCKEL